ncbi:hypothetical protein [uncultured Thiohalocapsa sp.]|uniref:hypothetical protein n=1 Tax=uncultured Thiohalocapsa sp. TaxID=768990 RepID=UPI0025FD1D0B|nr:hypothetical protein [uncultured Thiohalocapsa sp.]
MPRYSKEGRAAVVAKLLPPQRLSPQAVAAQEGLSLATVYKWRKEARIEGRCLPNADAQDSTQWSSKDRFAAVLETAAMNAVETAAYCRRWGL